MRRPSLFDRKLLCLMTNEAGALDVAGLEMADCNAEVVPLSMPRGEVSFSVASAAAPRETMSLGC